MEYEVTAELKSWLDSQLARGCTRESLVAAMQQAGHPLSFAEWLVNDAPVSTDVPAQPLPGFDEKLLEALRQNSMTSPSSVLVNGHCVEILLALNSPRTVLFGNFLSAEECDSLVAASAAKLDQSLVVDPDTGAFRKDAARISEGTYFSRGETPLVAAIEERVKAVLGFDLSYQEPMQILHYGVGGKYDAHYDFCDPVDKGSAVFLKSGGQRVATLVMYLNDVELGGATIFPRLALEVKPRKGHAVYFESMDDNGKLDINTLHMGAPVGQGEKWIATKWMRETEYL